MTTMEGKSRLIDSAYTGLPSAVIGKTVCLYYNKNDWMSVKEAYVLCIYFGVYAIHRYESESCLPTFSWS